MKEYFKHLGVYIDADLSWKHHIEHISGKMSKCVGVVANLRHFVPTYDICAWGQGAKARTNKLFIFQKRALRLVFFAYPKEYAISLSQQTRSLPLTFSYFERLSLIDDA